MIESLGAIAAARDPMWREAYLADDLLGRTLRGFDSANLLVTEEISGIEGEAFTAALRVVEWYRLNAPGQLDGLIARLIRATTRAGGRHASHVARPRPGGEPHPRRGLRGQLSLRRRRRPAGSHPPPARHAALYRPRGRR